MPLYVLLVILATLISGSLYVVAKYRSSWWMMVIFKPLTMLPIITLAVYGISYQFSWHGLLIVLGLLWGLVGDVFLLKPSGFKAGLVAFLIGHLCHLAGFIGLMQAMPDPLWLAIYSLVVLGITAWLLRQIWPKAGKLRIPVLAYFVVIGSFGFAAVALWSSQSEQDYAIMIVVGACSFLLSDSVLGYERLVAKQWYSPAVISITYYAAQLLLALSVLQFSGLTIYG